MNVLMLSVSKKIPMIKAVREAIRRIDPGGGLYGADINPACIGSYFVDQFWACPTLDELPIGQLIEYCIDHDITSIIPSRDGELAYLAEHRDRLGSNGIHPMISDPATVAMCQDKLLFAQRLIESGFPVIPTYADLNFDAALVVVKERFGAGSHKTGIGLAREQARIHANQLNHPIYQPYIDGKECSIDVYVEHNGQVKGVVLRERVLVVDGESQITKTFRNAQIEAMVADLATRFGFYGHVMFQIIIDSENRYHIIECNCRFGGASTLSIAAGLDSFYWFLQESRGLSLDSMLFDRSSQEKTLIRHAEDLIV